MSTPIQDFFKGRSIFITGGSGLMGKVLIEKLLYAASDIEKIYLLLRPKRGKSVEKRFEDMWKTAMFHRLREEKPHMREKVIAIQGDVLFENLGIDASILENIKNEVSIVYHFAATLKLEAAMKDALDMNTSGTKRTLNIARSIKNLDLFVHLSTAFCYPDYERLDERFHEPPANPYDLMRLIQWLDEKQLEILTPSLLGLHPNCYTYSKRLAESLVNEAYNDIPTVIVRPSIVCPAYKEPLEGWVDNLNGPIGVIIGAGKGVIRTMMCDGELFAQVIPVDVAINAIITLTYVEVTKTKKTDEIPVYNVSNGDQNTANWQTILEIGKEYGRKNPFEWPLWYPNGCIRTNRLTHEINKFLFHLIPAYLLDLLFLILGQKQFMVRIQNRISLGLELLQYFTTRPWIFETRNFSSLQDIISPQDKKLFFMDIKSVEIKSYIETCILGGRLYCLKEPLCNLPKARLHHNVLFVLDIIFKGLFFYLIFYMMVSHSESLQYLLSFGGPVVKNAPLIGQTVFKT